MNVHYRKGSLLDYDGVYLAEGQWPAKAYFDAMRQARKRDAAMFIDYGYTRPNVVSQGPVQQLTDEGCETEGSYDGMQEMGPAPEPIERSEEKRCRRRNAPEPSAAAPSAVGTSAPLGSELVPRSPATPSRVLSMNVKRITRQLKLLQCSNLGVGETLTDWRRPAATWKPLCGIEAWVPIEFNAKHGSLFDPCVPVFCRLSISHLPEAPSLVVPANELGRSDRLPFCEPTHASALKLGGSLPATPREHLRMMLGVIRIQPTPVSPLLYQSQAKVSGLNEIMWWILSYGDRAEVLEPLELRQMTSGVCVHGHHV